MEGGGGYRGHQYSGGRGRALQAKPARWELSEQEQVNNVVRIRFHTLH